MKKPELTNNDRISLANWLSWGNKGKLIDKSAFSIARIILSGRGKASEDGWPYPKTPEAFEDCVHLFDMLPGWQEYALRSLGKKSIYWDFWAGQWEPAEMVYAQRFRDRDIEHLKGTQFDSLQLRARVEADCETMYSFYRLTLQNMHKVVQLTRELELKGKEQ